MYKLELLCAETCVADVESDVDLEAGSEVDVEVAEGADTGTERTEENLEAGAGAGADADGKAGETDCSFSIPRHIYPPKLGEFCLIVKARK